MCTTTQVWFKHPLSRGTASLNRADLWEDSDAYLAGCLFVEDVLFDLLVGKHHAAVAIGGIVDDVVVAIVADDRNKMPTIVNLAADTVVQAVCPRR